MSNSNQEFPNEIREIKAAKLQYSAADVSPEKVNGILNELL